MLFCPFCGTLLGLERGANAPSFRHFCPTCRYVAPVRETQTTTFDVGASKAAAVVASAAAAGDDLNEALSERGRPRTNVRCDASECGSTEAFFVQLQIRSADEPPTTFYECCTCKKRWRTD
jgi:DNA-directed RNA polymerase III subunit RPC11